METEYVSQTTYTVARRPGNAEKAVSPFEFVSVRQGDGQGLMSVDHQISTATGAAVDQAAPDADHECADAEKQAAGTEGDIERHDLSPR